MGQVQVHAKIGRNNIFSTYGDVHSVSDLRCAIDELFLPRDAMHKRGYSRHAAAILQICPSVTFRYQMKTA